MYNYKIKQGLLASVKHKEVAGTSKYTYMVLLFKFLL